MSRHYPRAGTGEDRTSLYDEITNKIIAELEAGRVPWVQPWGSAAKASLALPKSAATGRQYSGINILILWGAAILAFLDFIEGERAGLSAADGSVKFGRAHAGITQQILPVFSEGLIAQARSEAAQQSLYLPPEVRP